MRLHTALASMRKRVAIAVRRGVPWQIGLAAILCVLGAARVGWNGPAYDLSALVVGAEVLRVRPSSLYEHDATFYNLTGSDEYRNAASRLGFQGESTPFVHPPLVAWVARPLTSIPFHITKRLWLIGAVAALLAGLALLGRVLAPSRDALKATAAVMSVMCVFEPTLYAFWLGQTTPFIFLLVALAFSLGDKRPHVGGVCLGVATFVKLTPVLLFLPWLATKKFRAIAAGCTSLALLGCASVFTCGIEVNSTYVHRIVEISKVTLTAYNNQSLTGVITRALSHDVRLFEWPNVAPAPIARIISPLFAMLGCVSIWRTARSGRSTVAFALALVVVLLLPTISWTHYFLFLVPVALVVWRGLSELGLKRWTWLGLAPLLLLVRPIALRDLSFGPGPFDCTSTTFFVAVCYAVSASWLSLSSARY